jgi:hypothetical protein
MGLDTAAVNFLCYAKNNGVNFAKTLTIGRQSFQPELNFLKNVFKSIGTSFSAEKFILDNCYGEKFFRELGAQSVDSIDYSDYQGATIQHDLNIPIDNALKNKYTVVYDGGTLEHIFNIPEAFRNCMKMVTVGGHFIQGTVANNFMGHGFWQISPELIFRVFSKNNGFSIHSVLLYHMSGQGEWYLVSDPDDIKQRVLLCNSNPVYLFTIAKKIADVDIFSVTPMQSDYVATWEKAQNLEISKPNSSFKSSASSRNLEYLKKIMPNFILMYLKKINHKRILWLQVQKIHKRTHYGIPPRVDFSASYYIKKSTASMITGNKS